MPKHQLIEIIRQKALFHGKFELAGGQTSNYYIDLSKVALDSTGLHLIASLIIDKVDNWSKIDSIGGPAYGSIPITSSVITLMKDSSFSMKSFFVRKETKGYGKKELIEGYLEKDYNVVLIEDVTTTGKSLLKSVEEVRKKGCNIVQLVSVVDRLQGAEKLFDIPFKSILTIDEIL